VEPRIQYAQTKDGVSIAFWTMGEGTPIVFAPPIPWSHIQREWQWPGYRAYYERLMQGRRLVRYDGRGSGLSDRDVNDYSLDAHLLDLEAVVDRARLETFALLAPMTGGPAAVAYAVRHPERVSHLLLWASYARGSDFFGAPQIKAIRKLRDEDWETHSELAGQVATGFSQPDEARRWAAFIRESVTREALKAHGGSEVKALGDGFMTSFSSATKALECAIAMQRAFAQRNESAKEPMLVRVGLNAGEPIAEDDDLYGTAVNEAARITATAKGGEILVSDVVRQLVKGKDFLFADCGEVSLKGFDEPVRLHEVRWAETRATG
jgi:pimeloyl-ACP methyl ester carboxylesterase